MDRWRPQGGRLAGLAGESVGPQGKAVRSVARPALRLVGIGWSSPACCAGRRWLSRRALLQANDQVLPSQAACSRSPSWPRAKTSIRSRPQEQALGSEVIWPPSDSHGCQPSGPYQRCHSAPLRPLANTSIRSAPHEHAVGFPVSSPPCACHSCHASPSQYRLQSCPSSKMQKTCISFCAQLVTAGVEASAPLRESQFTLAPPSSSPAPTSGLITRGSIFPCKPHSSRG